MKSKYKAQLQKIMTSRPGRAGGWKQSRNKPSFILGQQQHCANNCLHLTPTPNAPHCSRPARCDRFRWNLGQDGHPDRNRAALTLPETFYLTHSSDTRAGCSQTAKGSCRVLGRSQAALRGRRWAPSRVGRPPVLLHSKKGTLWRWNTNQL